MPPEMSASTQCAPARSMWRASTWNTWLDWKFAHTRSSPATARRQWCASAASTLAATAPAEVPTITWKGLRARGSISASANSTPT